MNTSLRAPAVAGILLVAIAGCSQTSAPINPGSAPADPVSSASWSDLLGEVSAPEGWDVTPCDNPILLCVEADGQIIGTVEHLSYPLDTLDLESSVDVQQDGAEALLQAWVSEHYDAIESDRLIGYDNASFAADEPEAIRVGSLPGLRYGYTITHANGTAIDDAVVYVATDGDRLHVFVTGVISQDPAGSLSDPAALAEFEPHLDAIIRELRL